MTVDQTCPGEPPGFDEAMSRDDVIEAWRERRRARRSQDTAPDSTSHVDGFALRRWRKAGVFGEDAVRSVEALVKRLLSARPNDGDTEDAARRTLTECLAGDPSSQLPSAIRTVLETGSPEQTVDVMTVVHEASLPWLSPTGQQRLAHLMTLGPSELAPDERPSASEDGAGAFALQHAVRNGEDEGLSAALLTRILPWIPLGIVDDLIDAGAITRRTGPWRLRASDYDQQYLLARLSPEYVEPEAADALAWDQAVERRRFLAGEDVEAEEGSLYDLLQLAAEGDPSVLKELEHLLPRPLVLRVRQVRDGALTGNWEADILGDRGLWRLMAALWEPRAAIVPARSPFHALVALRHAYDMICVRDFKRARAQVEKLVGFEGGDPRQLDEAWNMWAYLALIDEDLDKARVGLAHVADHAGRAQLNLVHVTRRQEVPRNNRSHAENPYLELGLPDRSEAWKKRYRDLRHEYADDREEAARLNKAMRRIQKAELAEDWSDFYVLPLDRTVFDLPVARPVTLVPPVEPMPRRTAPGDREDFETVRRRAVADLFPTLLNAPRRPDHQHRTTT
ncbi:hypothetical protein [Streptomyces gardneri]|uniref:hypothetical protein n=1 Tax=Streptomyces gardneri TaxID=66892 RepID=UPI0035D75F17